MMKKALIFAIAIFNISLATAQIQYDSIYTSNEGLIVASVKEVTIDAVKFSYPNEDLMNSMPKTRIVKIVFKSGRVQTFSESASLKKVIGVEDWANVSLSRVESEVQGLFKLGDISVKAKNTTGFESSSKINDRAFKKLKMEAALKGANIIYIISETSVGNKMGTQYQAGQAAETQISGIAYSSYVPKFSDFVKILKDKNTALVKVDELGNNSTTFSTTEISNKNTPISNFQERDSFIFVNASIDGAKGNEFRITYFDSNKIILMEDYKGKVTNYTLAIQ